MSRLDDMAAVIADINKKHGDNTVVLASDVHDMIPRVPTGSLGLDLILGGGWPANQWVELVGAESSGKTAVALKTIAVNQERDPEWTCVWIAAEKWVSEYAQMLGVDLTRVAIVETNSMEDAYDACIRFADSRAADCIVIDSLPALVPTSEDEKDMEQSTVGRGALLTGKFFRKVGKATKRNLDGSERPVLGIVINQWRQKIGVMYGDPRTTPGGVGKNYAYFVRIEVSRGDFIEVGSGNDKTKIGQQIKFKTIKNKTAPAQRTSVVDFYFGDGGEVGKGEYDFAKELVSIAVLEGIITRGGAFYKYDDQSWRGQAALMEAVREEVDLYESIKREVVELMERKIH